MDQKLDGNEIARGLAKLPNWTRQGQNIQRVFQFQDFKESMVFVNRVAELAESADHHPDITIHWNKVTLTLTTHSANGLTAKDIALARQIDSLK